MNTKFCNTCKNTKPATVEFFYTKSGNGKYFRSECKSCLNNKNKAYMYSATKEQKKRYNKKYRETHKNELLEYTEKYRKTNSVRLREAREKYRKKQYKSPSYRLSRNISRAIWTAIRSNKAGRSFQDVLGYSIDDLKNHLERQFTGKMSWANYGELWHVDHITPLCLFSFSSPLDEDFRAAWALTNLMPLTGKENCAKGGKRIYLL